MTVTVDGADRLAATLTAAAAELGELSAAHGDVAGLIARAVRPPRRTGRLAGSVRPSSSPDGALVEVGAPYAGAVAGGVPARGIPPRPFLRAAVESTQPAWEDIYRRAVQATVDQVRGD